MSLKGSFFFLEAFCCLYLGTGVSRVTASSLAICLIRVAYPHWQPLMKIAAQRQYSIRVCSTFELTILFAEPCDTCHRARF